MNLIYGDYIDISPDHEQVFAYTRKGEKAKYLVLLNLSDTDVRFGVGSEFEGYELLIGNLPNDNNVLDFGQMKLQPWEARLYVSN